MTEPMLLEDLQREMAAAIMMPLTADDGMRSHSADGRAMEQVAASFVAPNSRLTPVERLEIYNRQYWFRVLGALDEDFPSLRAVVGSRAFVGTFHRIPRRASQPLVLAAQSGFAAGGVACRHIPNLPAGAMRWPWMWRALNGRSSKHSTARNASRLRWSRSPSSTRIHGSPCSRTCSFSRSTTLPTRS